MSEMIERIADALDGCLASQSHQVDFVHKHYCLIARVAIETMRKPTDAMLDAAYAIDTTLDPVAPGDAWQAMIDEALK